MAKERKWEPRAVIKSFSGTGKSYTISENKQHQLGCNCPGWIFQKGRDEKGYCKHIRALLEVVKHDAIAGLIFYDHAATIDVEGEKYHVMDAREENKKVTHGVQL